MTTGVRVDATLRHVRLISSLGLKSWARITNLELDLLDEVTALVEDLTTGLLVTL